MPPKPKAAPPPDPNAGIVRALEELRAQMETAHASRETEHEQLMKVQEEQLRGIQGLVGWVWVGGLWFLCVRFSGLPPVVFVSSFWFCALLCRTFPKVSRRLSQRQSFVVSTNLQVIYIDLHYFTWIYIDLHWSTLIYIDLH